MFYAIFGYNRCYKIIGFKWGRVESGCELMMYDEKRTGGAGMVEKEEFSLNSTNGVNKLHVISWHPLDEIRAIVQISHGMCEYVDRYDRLATFLAQHGIMVIGNDHLGHGETARDEDELGYFPGVNGSETVVDDLYKVTTSIRAQYPLSLIHI